MGQVTIYLDAETEIKMNKMVKSSGLSKSKWIAELIKEKTVSEWPEHVKRLAGAWQDMPSAEELRRDLGKDIKRAVF